MKQGKILLIDLGGDIGSEVSQFLGLILMSGIFRKARMRSKSIDRTPFFVYLDGFQNFTTSHMNQLFSEGRKFNVGLTVAHQHMHQLPEETLNSIKGNVGNWLSFLVGVEDSKYLSAEMYPISEEDFIQLPRYQMMSKLVFDNQPVKPFPIRSLPNIHVSYPGNPDNIRKLSRQKYGTHAAIVKANIRARFLKHKKDKTKKSGLFDLFSD